MANVRGMGVADIISWCGLLPFLRSASRCATPKRCCSSTMARPSRAKSTPSWISACVPTISCASLAVAASCSRLALLFRLPDNQATLTPSGSSQPESFRKCCSARISVGAMKAACQPAEIAWQAASAATMVLPAPTSPCSRRCIGCGCARSAPISAIARACAPVRPKGRLSSKRAPRLSRARSTGAPCSRRAR